MFSWYGTIKQYYGLGLYTAEQLAVFVAAGWITQAEADGIAGVNGEGA